MKHVEIPVDQKTLIFVSMYTKILMHLVITMSEFEILLNDEFISERKRERTLLIS